MQIRYITFTRTPAGTYIKAETPKQHSRAARNAQRRAALTDVAGIFANKFKQYDAARKAI